MTAKEELLRFVTNADEDTASDAWDLIRNFGLVEREPLTPEQIVFINRAIEKRDAADRRYTTEEVLSRIARA